MLLSEIQIQLKGMSMKKNKKVKAKVSRILTMSKYIDGRHFVKDNCQTDKSNRYSFAESLSPLHFMIEELGEAKIPLGTKIKVTMQVI
jgi:phage-related protein